jgi:type IV pilus assembly protein PilX
MTSTAFRRPTPLHARQDGAVLYVALILLLLLTLLGIAGVQASAMQERMSSAWRAGNVAFQASEAANRGRELQLAAQALAGAVLVDTDRCLPFDPGGWAEGELGDGEIGGVFVQRIDQCVAGGGSLAQGVRPESEGTDDRFQITAFATDVTAVGDERTAEAVIDTIFIP